MYDYVQEYWKEEIKQLKKQIAIATMKKRTRTERKLNGMEETDMAVVISQEQKWTKHLKLRTRYWNTSTEMVKWDLDKEFKDSENHITYCV